MDVEELGALPYRHGRLALCYGVISNRTNRNAPEAALAFEVGRGS